MSSFSGRKLEEAILRLYESAVQPQLWQSALADLASAVDAEGVIMIDRRREGGVSCVWSNSVDEQMNAFVRNGWWNRNYRFERGMSLVRKNGVITESMLCSSQELDREPLQGEFLDRFGLRWFAGLSVVSEPDTDLLLSIERRARADPFSRGEISIFQKALPHIRRIGQLAISTSASVASDILWGLDQFAKPAALLDGRGRVIQLNAHAERLLGAGIRIIKGRLVAEHRASDRALQDLIRSAIEFAAERAPEPAVLLRPSRRPLIAHVAPIVRSAADIFGRAKAIVMFVDPEAKPRSPSSILRAAFALTPAETRIALSLARGDELRQAADAGGITFETARVHLKSIFAKTHTHSQVELALLLSKLEL